MLIYKNLNKGLWSIKDKKVVGYESCLLISNPSFKTSLATQTRIKNIFDTTGKRERNVHAYIVGDIVNNNELDITGLERISYNPFFSHLFYLSSTKELLETCNYKYIYFHRDGYAYGIN